MIHPSEPVLSAAAAAVLLTFAAASAAAMTPGVYSAAVPSRNGELAVEVQVSADRIESVKVVRQIPPTTSPTGGRHTICHGRSASSHTL